MSQNQTRNAVAPANGGQVQGGTRARAEAIMRSVNDIINTALPSTVKPEAFRDVFITVAQREPKLFQADVKTLQQALIQAARSGLVPDGKMSALVPFKNTKEKKLEVQFIVMVAGYIHLFKKHAGVHSMTVNVVREKDRFTYIEGIETVFEHRPDVFAEDRGPMVGVYAIFRDKDGKVMHIEIMSRADVMKAKAVSKMSNGPWVQFEEEMWRKTVVRRSAKYLPLTHEAQKILDEEDANTIDFDLPSHNHRPADYNPILAASGIDEGGGQGFDSYEDTSEDEADEDGVVQEPDAEDPPFETSQPDQSVRPRPSDEDLDKAWGDGIEAKESGQPRKVPGGYPEELAATWLQGWDKGTVKEAAPKAKDKAPAKDVGPAPDDKVVAAAKRAAMDGQDREPGGDVPEAQRGHWFTAYDAQVKDLEENG